MISFDVNCYSSTRKQLFCFQKTISPYLQKQLGSLDNNVTVIWEIAIIERSIKLSRASAGDHNTFSELRLRFGRRSRSYFALQLHGPQESKPVELERRCFVRSCRRLASSAAWQRYAASSMLKCTASAHPTGPFLCAAARSSAHRQCRVPNTNFLTD